MDYLMAGQLLLERMLLAEMSLVVLLVGKYMSTDP